MKEKSYREKMRDDTDKKIIDFLSKPEPDRFEEKGDMVFPAKTKCGKCYTSCSACPYNADCSIAKENRIIDLCHIAYDKRMAEIKSLQRAVDAVMNMHEIDSYIMRVHGGGKYSTDSMNAYNECIRDIKRVVKSELEAKW